uniref:Uncharacterized protein n=1 Tax=Sphaerodactylus townsendi TaxID=933632 RepID=A0ACB8F4Z6_9SAUR
MISSETQPGGASAAADNGCPIPEDLTGTSDSASDPAEGPRIPLGSARSGEAPTPSGFLDSINQFMTAQLDGSQGVTMHHRQGLDYQELQPLAFSSVMWATAPLAGNVSLPSHPSEGADLSEAEAWRMLQVLEEAWDSEREEYRQAVRQMGRDMEHLRAALAKQCQVAPAPGPGIATTPATPAPAQPAPARPPAPPIQPGPAPVPVPAQPAQQALVLAPAPVSAAAPVPAQPVQPGPTPAPVPAQPAQPALVLAPAPGQPVHPGPTPAPIPVPGQPLQPVPGAVLLPPYAPAPLPVPPLMPPFIPPGWGAPGGRKGHIAVICPAKRTPTPATSIPVAKLAKTTKLPPKGGTRAAALHTDAGNS